MSVCLTGQPPSHPDAVDTHMNLKAIVDEGNIHISTPYILYIYIQVWWRYMNVEVLSSGMCHASCLAIYALHTSCKLASTE